ncbi:DUF6602 domain-containing protein [Xanthomonas arboricola]|uniref:DUF6602 domain-containing protein n=1 Tax=Xanthomonas arboricola TaxID=56448 RepID=UPI0011B0DA53|nr:DUF6602 domain-containing protein [Xanthomonas arboricola]
MKPLIEYFRAVVNALNAQYEATAVLGHSVTAGAARERLIQDFLKSHLPEMTSIVSGVIIDSDGRRSKQQDIVLMLKSMPRLPFSSGHDLIFQEGVVATFEIKTEIRPAKIKEIAENIRSVKRLVPSSLGGVELGDLTWPYDRILIVVVTYGGSDLSIIKDALVDMEPLGRPDVYIDLKRGALIANEGLLLDQDGLDEYLRFDGAEVGVARLFVLLSKMTGRLVMRTVKWERYIS